MRWTTNCWVFILTGIDEELTAIDFKPGTTSSFSIKGLRLKNHTSCLNWMKETTAYAAMSSLSTKFYNDVDDGVQNAMV